MLKPYEQRFPWNLDWNLLRTFMVVVDEGGITPAAHFLSLKQPTISAALKRLEDITGRKLINRSPKHFSVTPWGRLVYAEASSIFGIVTQLPDLMSSLEDEVTGHISIAAASHVVSPHFDAVLQRFNALYPSVSYTISTVDSSEVIALLHQNRVTLGICLLQEHPVGLETRVLYREYFGLFCGPLHRLYGQENINISELKNEDAVSFHTDEIHGPLSGVAQMRRELGMRPDPKGLSACLLCRTRDAAHQADIASTIDQSEARLCKPITQKFRLCCIIGVITGPRAAVNANRFLNHWTAFAF